MSGQKLIIVLSSIAIDRSWPQNELKQQVVGETNNSAGFDTQFFCTLLIRCVRVCICCAYFSLECRCINSFKDRTSETTNWSCFCYSLLQPKEHPTNKACNFCDEAIACLYKVIDENRKLETLNRTFSKQQSKKHTSDKGIILPQTLRNGAVQIFEAKGPIFQPILVTDFTTIAHIIFS